MALSETGKGYGWNRPEDGRQLKEMWERIHFFMRGQYDPAWKDENVVPVLKEMSEKGELGEVVVDVGAGHSSLVRNLANKHTVGTMDIVRPSPTSPEHFAIQADLRSLDKPKRRTKKDLLQAAHVLKERGLPRQVNTFVLADTLNYIDYRKLLKELDIVLAPGGRLIIINEPGLGPGEFMEPNATRLHRNSELLSFLESPVPRGMGYFIERPRHRDSGYLDTMTDRLIVVARKPLDF